MQLNTKSYCRILECDAQKPTKNNAPNSAAIIYKPSEILGIIASYFSQQDVS